MNRKIGIMLSYVVMIIEVCSTLLLTPLTIRTLGQAEYGVYKLIIAINTYLLLLDLGVGNATVRYISKYRANNDETNERKFIAVSIFYFAVVAILALIAGSILVAIFPVTFSKGLTVEEIELGQKLLLISTLASAITLGSASYSYILIAYEKFAVFKGSIAIQVLIKMILTYIALKLGMKSFEIVLINLVLTFLLKLFVILYVTFRMKIKPLYKNIEKTFVKEIVGYSSLILLQMIAAQINSSVDQILIGSIVPLSSTLLAIYGVGAQIILYYQSIGNAVTDVVMPGVVGMVEKDATESQIADEMTKIGRIVLVVLALIFGVFIVEGKAFIELWAGHANIEAYFVAAILMFAYSLTLSESVGVQVLWAKNEQKELSVLKLGIVLLNVLLTVFLIKWNPLIGAAIGTFISIMLGDVILSNVLFYKKFKLNIFKYYLKLFKGILPCTLIVIILGLFINRIIIDNTWIAFFVKSIVLIIAYLVAMLLFGFNKDEKEMIFSIFSKRRDN